MYCSQRYRLFENRVGDYAACQTMAGSLPYGYRVGTTLWIMRITFTKTIVFWSLLYAFVLYNYPLVSYFTMG